MTDKKTSRLLSDLGTIGWSPGLTKRSYSAIANAGFRGQNTVRAAIIAELAVESQPVTLRGLFYRCVSAGLFPSTDEKHYNATKRLTGEMRKRGIIPFSWIVDSLRATEKPSSWAGLSEFTETVRHAYRKDFWSQLDWYLHIISEKDAIAGTIAPVTREYDVALSPIRGNISHSFAYSLGSQFSEIKKPILIAYLGDWDPNGLDIERDLQRKLEEHSGRYVYPLVDTDHSNIRQFARFSFNSELIHWVRLGVNSLDFDEHNLLPLPVKKSDSRAKKFVEVHGTRCAEVDALPPTELRERVRTLIEAFIPQEEWERLKTVEALEQETFNEALRSLAS